MKDLIIDEDESRGLKLIRTPQDWRVVRGEKTIRQSVNYQRIREYFSEEVNRETPVS